MNFILLLWLLSFDFGPTFAFKFPLGSVPCPNKRKGRSSSLLGLTCSVRLGRGWSLLDTIGVCGETCGKLLQSEAVCALPLRRWPQVMCPSAEMGCSGSWKGEGNDLYLLIAWWQFWSRCITSGTAAAISTPTLKLPLALAYLPLRSQSTTVSHPTHATHKGRALWPASTGD